MTVTSPPPATPADHEWLPERCPSWCIGEHARVIAENGDEDWVWRQAQEHYGPAYGASLPDVHNATGKQLTRRGGASYDLTTRQQTCHSNGAYSEDPVIQLEVCTDFFPGMAMRLLPGEARTLARQLTKLADVLELDG